MSLLLPCYTIIYDNVPCRHPRHFCHLFSSSPYVLCCEQVWVYFETKLWVVVEAPHQIERWGRSVSRSGYTVLCTMRTNSITHARANKRTRMPSCVCHVSYHVQATNSFIDACGQWAGRQAGTIGTIVYDAP